jgi:hypothetical protein
MRRPNKFWIAAFEEVCKTNNGRNITPDQPPVESSSAKDSAMVL